MRAIILAAGRGTRLQHYTSDRPKCLVEIAGASLLDHQLRVLRSRGIEDVVIVGGYRAEMLGAKGLRLRKNPRWWNTNMVWSLFCAEEEIDGDVIISYGDIVYSARILELLMASSAEITVAVDSEWERYWSLRSENPLADAETLRVGPRNRIVEIGRKPESVHEIDGQFMGLLKLTSIGGKQLREIFHETSGHGRLDKRSVEAAHMTDLLQELINRGYTVTAEPIDEPWVEIDTVRDLELKESERRVYAIADGYRTPPPR